MKSYYGVLFLKEFTKELLKNATPLYINEKIEQEEKDIFDLKEKIDHKVREDFILKRTAIPTIKNKQVKEELKELAEENVDLKGMQKSILEHKKGFSPMQFIPKRQKPIETKDSVDDTTPFMEISQESTMKVYPEEGLYLGDIERLVNDHKVASIECPGPDKFISIHIQGKTMPTRIQMHKEDINAVLESFSRESRIPRIGGIFKSIVNNLVLTAIDTDVAGPRFIITKIHPQESMYL